MYKRRFMYKEKLKAIEEEFNELQNKRQEFLNNIKNIEIRLVELQGQFKLINELEKPKGEPKPDKPKAVKE